MRTSFNIRVMVYEDLFFVLQSPKIWRKISCLLQETFLNQNIEIIWNNIASKGKASLDILLDFTFTVIFKQRKLDENEVTKKF